MTQAYDVIVVGLGAVGSAAAYQLAKRGKRTLGIDRFSPPHSLGSTHGDTRITRQAIGEGLHYTPLSLRSYELFREVERDTGATLLTVTGGLIISSEGVSSGTHVPGFFANTVEAAHAYNIGHDLLDAPEIRRRFPQFSVHDGERGYLEHGAGFLRPEACVRAQLALAERHGAELRTGERVVAYATGGGSVSVKTDRAEYTAERLILSAGPWLLDLIGEPYRDYFAVRRQVLHWFEIAGEHVRFEPGHFPVFIWQFEGEQRGFYGFPAIDGPGGGIKLATEQYDTTTTADTVDRAVGEEEPRVMYERCVAGRLPGPGPGCLRSAVCLYTCTPDSEFVLDAHPEQDGVIIASPCSGHGFKHSAAVGEALAQIIAEGRARLDLSKFGLARSARGSGV